MLLVAVPSTANAGDKMYSWKPNVTSEAMTRDQTACMKYASDVANGKKVSNPYNPVTQSAAAGAMGGAFATGFAAGIMKAKVRNAAFYGCLADAGYSRRGFPEAEFKEFKKLKDDARKGRLTELSAPPVARHPEMPADEYD